MVTVVVFSQNLILTSLEKFVSCTSTSENVIFITTHFLFENERNYLNSLFGKCIFTCFADWLTDQEMENCDKRAYTSEDIDYADYLMNIKKQKNNIVIEKISNKYPDSSRYIFSDDLGIYMPIWVKNGFKMVSGEYYYCEGNKRIKLIKAKLSQIYPLKKIYRVAKKGIINNTKKRMKLLPEEVLTAYYQGRKYVFIGKMDRIDYRLDIKFEQSPEECEKINQGKFEPKETCTYMTTWHEHSKCQIPDSDNYSVRWAQDGYLPPNYSHYDYFFKPANVVYYCWDKVGTYLFVNQGLPYEMIPFRKKMYLPEPQFPTKVKNVLIVASGSGDWTALKNRSDDDIMVEAFVKIARKFPNIQFTYRCHPTWIHPLNVGVNAFNRVNEYFNSLEINNIRISANIPLANETDKFKYTFSRSSLEEDLACADLVFGEHSISMIDAAFSSVPFASVNLTNRRNFFVGINDLGFPSCSTIDVIADIINNVSTTDFQKDYLEAVKNYNSMTDEIVIKDPWENKQALNTLAEGK